MMGRELHTRDQSQANSPDKMGTGKHNKNFSKHFRNNSSIAIHGTSKYHPSRANLQKNSNHSTCFNFDQEMINHHDFQELIKPKLTRVIDIEKMPTRDKHKTRSNKKFNFKP